MGQNKKDLEKIKHENLAFTPMQSYSFDVCDLTRACQHMHH